MFSSSEWRRRSGRLVMLLVALFCFALILHFKTESEHQQGNSMILQEVGLLNKLEEVPSYVDQPQAIQIEQDMLNREAVGDAADRNFVGKDQEDPSLITEVKKLINPPSKLPYNLKRPTAIHYSQFRQSELADELFLKGKKNGVFVEVGGYEGESLSNSLYFEKTLGWTGLLVEPDPILWDTLFSKHRKCYTIHAGLAFNERASVSTTRYVKGRRIAEAGKEEKGKPVINVFPLYTLLKALNFTVVDFFSLDVESDEMKILQTIPWDKIKFRLIVMETSHSKIGIFKIIEYMELASRPVAFPPAPVLVCHHLATPGQHTPPRCPTNTTHWPAYTTTLSYQDYTLASIHHHAVLPTLHTGQHTPPRCPTNTTHWPAYTTTLSYQDYTLASIHHHAVLPTLHTGQHTPLRCPTNTTHWPAYTTTLSYQHYTLASIHHHAVLPTLHTGQHTPPRCPTNTTHWPAYTTTLSYQHYTLASIHHHAVLPRLHTIALQDYTSTPKTTHWL
ncbi:hypothetical protein Pcinc_011649 [Petrolisthes cinctipes]|uniref:Methyltransferase FkbM domain-containing protein n=1 Tax=Petrolisthes cinctipes TaxID=88211 RepID=A0AAE1KSA8_PETCI|nr:hypothetical protein Pcinc_011649 [Petrolisthes cinctipes]